MTREPCQQCPKLNACRQAVLALNPIHCEQPPGDDSSPGERRIGARLWAKHYAHPNLQPGQLFTTADLMALTGQTLQAAGEWCAYHREIIRDIEHVATNKDNRKVYRFAPTERTSPQ